MAKRKRDPSPLTARVIIDQIGRTTGFTLPVNEHFEDPNEIDEERGVELSAPEVRQAERAIASTVLAEYFPADLRSWIGRQARRRAGMVGLTRELVAMRPIPQGRDPEKFRKALLRSIERSGPEQKPGRKEKHGTIRNADYGMRIALLELRERVVILGVTGWWMVYDDKSEFRGLHTDRKKMDQRTEVYQVLANGGAGFVAHIVDIASKLNRPMELESVHALDVKVMPHD